MKRLVTISKNSNGKYVLSFERHFDDKTYDEDGEEIVDRIELDLASGYISIDEKLGNDYWEKPD